MAFSPSPLTPAPDPGPETPVDVRPEDYYQAGKDFVRGQNRVMRVYDHLLDRLGELSGAAGNDDAARAFAESYTPGVRQVIRALVRAHELIGTIATGLAIAADNHRRADADAAGHTDSGEFPPLWPDSCPAATEPPSILGAGDENLLAVLSDWVNPYYPNGHVDKMHDVSGVFAHVKRELTDIGQELDAKLVSLVNNNTAADLDALDRYWRRVAISDATLLETLPRACEALEQSCWDYASAVERTRNTIGDIVERTSLELAAATGVGFVGSLLTTPVGGGLAGGGAGAAVLDTAAARLATVFGDFVLAVGSAGTTVAVADVAGTLTAAIINTPNPNVDPADHNRSDGNGTADAADDFRGSGYTQDEIAQFSYRHAGEGHPTMDRPALREIEETLAKGNVRRLESQNAEQFDYKGTRVIVNYDMPWKSTSYYPVRR